MSSSQGGAELQRMNAPLGSLSFEANRRIRSGQHQEWAKYVIGA
jgi:hypothetical protein